MTDSNSTTSELESGTTLSHYRVVSKIGSGGMGEVYLAEDTELGRRVALKVLLSEIATNEDRVQRFIQEAKAASALNHPNILTVYEIGDEKSSRYIATEFIDGETLREHWHSRRLTLIQMLDVAIQVAAALNAAHGAGIIHRDIKPENIMIREDGLAKVLDFGLAKLTEKRAETASSEDATRVQLNTKAGVIMGTAAYMSPEQARAHVLDPRSDIFSFGIVMFEMFTGERPFVGEESVDLISSILKDEPPSLRQVSADMPRQLERIVDKTLRKDRGQRYQNVKDLQIDLEDLRDELKFEAKLGKSVEITRPETLHETNAGNKRSTLSIPASISQERRFTLLHLLLFVALIGAVAGGVWWFGLRKLNKAAAPVQVKKVDLATWNSAPGELFSSASFSPDGNLIAFSSTRSGSKNIWVTQSATSQAIQVTNDAFSNKDPIWSPKGDELAFYSQRGNSPDGGSNVTGVSRVSALGGAPKQVGEITDGAFELRRWVASGNIYYQSRGDLYALKVADGSSQKVTSFDAKGEKLKWVSISADETQIAYVLQKEDSWQFFLSDVANVHPEMIADLKAEPVSVVWLPNKRRFFYSLMSDGASQVFYIDGTADPVQLSMSNEDGTVVDSAPDGHSIIVSSAKEESSLWRTSVKDGGDSPVSRGINSELWPSVSPDGQKVVFQSAKNLRQGSTLFQSSIMIKSLNSKDEQPRLLGESGFLPTWTPDGSSVAFLQKNNDSVALYTANPDGSGARRISSEGIPAIGYSLSPYNPIQTAAFSWSPDSERVAFVAVRGGASNVWTVSLRGGSETSVTANTDADYAFYFALRKTNDSNGKAIRELHVVNVRESQDLVVYSTDKNIRLIGWTSDEKGLIIASRSTTSGLPPDTELERVSVDGGTVSTIAKLINAYYYNIFLSSDRKFIGFVSRDRDKDDVWIVPSSGGEQRKLTNNNDSGVYFSRLAWLSDGSAMVFGKQTRFSLLSIISDIN
jgi:serine/threonine protein kinase